MLSTFLVLTGCLVVIYAGYPLAMWLLSASVGRELEGTTSDFPRAALMIPAHNEELVIEAKVRNFLALDYPADRLTAVVISDGSTDGTCDRVRALLETLPAEQRDRIRLADRTERAGKSVAISEEIAKLDVDLIVLTDANAFFRPDALKALVGPFADPEVGLVCGRLRYVDEGESFMSDEELYWRYEDSIKRWEGRAGRLLVANGSIYAVRSGLFEPLPGEVADDFATPLLAAAKGARLVYEPRAIAEEQLPAQGIENFRAKARIVTRGATALHLYWREVVASGPLRVLQYFLHKVARWLTGLVLAALFVVSLMGATHPLLAAALTAQVGFHLLGFAAYLMARRGPVPGVLRMPFYFVMVNAAALLGILHFVRGTRRVIWEKSETTRLTAHVPAPSEQDDEPAGRRFSWRTGVVVFAVLTFAALLGIETGLRLSYAARDQIRALRGTVTTRARLRMYEVPDVAHPGGWLLRPGTYSVGDILAQSAPVGKSLIEPLASRARALGLEPSDVAFRVNEQGYKGPPLHAERELPRVLVLGDSCAFGTVLDDFSFPRSLERELARIGTPAEVVNAGVRGYQAEHVLSRIVEFQGLEPEVTLICLGAGQLYAKPDETFGLSGRVYLLRLLRTLRRRLVVVGPPGASETVPPREPRPDPGAPGIRAALAHTPSFVGGVETISTAMLEVGSRVVLLTLPSIYVRGEEPTPEALRIGRLPEFTDNPYLMAAFVEGYNQALRELASRGAAEVADTAAWGRRSLVPRSQYFLNAGYLNERGLEAMGAELGRWLAPSLREASE